MTGAWTEVALQGAGLIVLVTFVVLNHLFLKSQKRVEAEEIEKNPYDWVVEISFWTGVVQSSLYTLLLAMAVKKALSDKV